MTLPMYDIARTALPLGERESRVVVWPWASRVMTPLAVRPYDESRTNHRLGIARRDYPEANTWLVVRFGTDLVLYSDRWTCTVIDASTLEGDEDETGE